MLHRKDPHQASVSGEEDEVVEDEAWKAGMQQITHCSVGHDKEVWL